MSFPDFSVADLNALSVEGSGLERQAVIPEAARDAEFDAAYDWTTLWYDAVQGPDELALVCPKLLNFKALIADGALRVDGKPARIRRVEDRRRYSIVHIPTDAPAQCISTRHARWQGESGVSPDGSDIFAGLNASLHISRNNRLDWISDWARFHVELHGLQAMLLMDNGSDDYPPEAILETLQTTGLSRAVVLKVPLPYGPPRSQGRSGAGKFLQPAMLNLARLRFLRRARAVLNVDIDELVRPEGGSIFDAAVNSPLGIVAFDGTWRYPAQDSTPPQRHADHLYPRPDAAPCPTKYCLRPDSLIAGRRWDVHRLELPLPSAWIRRRDLGYWHCRGITTNWKSYNRLLPYRLGPADPATETAMSRAFG